MTQGKEDDNDDLDEFLWRLKSIMKVNSTEQHLVHVKPYKLCFYCYKMELFVRFDFEKDFSAKIMLKTIIRTQVFDSSA